MSRSLGLPTPEKKSMSVAQTQPMHLTYHAFDLRLTPFNGWPFEGIQRQARLYQSAEIGDLFSLCGPTDFW